MRFTSSTLSSMGLAAGLVIAAVAFAPPSHAGSDCSSAADDLANGYSLAVGDSVAVNVSCLLNSQLNTSFVGTVSATTNNGGVTVTPNSVAATAGVASFTIQGSAAGSTLVTFSLDGVSVGSLITVTGGGGGGTSSGAVASAPVEVSLSLDLAASGATCAEGSAATGVAGAWLTLPGADECSSTAAPDARLLGWSTTAAFPEVIAQRQIDNGWGAYEMFDDEGRLTAVFIPAGQATFVSGPNSLHPIWAS